MTAKLHLVILLVISNFIWNETYIKICFKPDRQLDLLHIISFSSKFDNEKHIDHFTSKHQQTKAYNLTKIKAATQVHVGRESQTDLTIIDSNNSDTKTNYFKQNIKIETIPPSLDVASKRNIWLESKPIKGFIFNSAGIPTPFPTGSISPYFDVANFTYLQLNGFCGFLNNESYGYLVFYNDAKIILRVIGSAQIVNGDYYDMSKISNLKYVRFTSYAYNDIGENISVSLFKKIEEKAPKKRYANNVLKKNFSNHINFQNLTRGKIIVADGSYQAKNSGIITNRIKIPDNHSHMIITGNEQISYKAKSAYIVFKGKNGAILATKSYLDGIRNGEIFKIPQPSLSNPITHVEMTMRINNERIYDCAIYFLESADQKMVLSNGKIVGNSFDYTKNPLLVPSHLYALKNNSFSVFPSGMVRKYGKEKDIEISLNYSDGYRYYTKKVLEDLKLSKTVTGKFLIKQDDFLDKVLYKDVEINVIDPAEVEGTISWMAIGDSQTEGNSGNQASPYYNAKEQLKEYGVVVKDFGTYHTFNQDINLEYEARGGWRYRTFVGLESKYNNEELKIPKDTVSNQILKNENPFLFEASKEELEAFPDWCFNFSLSNKYNISYKENPNLGSYYIFNPQTYFDNRFNGDRPDIISIALGTNEWYIQQSIYNGFDLPTIEKSIRWMLKRLREAAPLSKIIVVPYHPIGFTRRLQWEDYAYQLAEYSTKVVEEMRENGDNRIYPLPIYCLDDPYSVIRDITDSKYISENNTLKIGTSSNNVHSMDYQGNNLDVYKRALVACILNIM